MIRSLSLRTRCAAASKRASDDPAAGREERARLAVPDRLLLLVDRPRLPLALDRLPLAVDREDFAVLLRARRVAPLEPDPELDLPELDLLELDLPEPPLLDPDPPEPPLLACGMLPPWIDWANCLHPTSRTYPGVGILRGLPALIGEQPRRLRVAQARRTVCRAHLV
jgi:hypothetical protein